MPTILDRKTNTISLKSKFVSRGRSKEQRERDKWRYLPPVKKMIMRYLHERKHQDYALIFLEFNRSSYISNAESKRRQKG
jgi:hypothetical protein